MFLSISERGRAVLGAEHFREIAHFAETAQFPDFFNLHRGGQEQLPGFAQTELAQVFPRGRVQNILKTSHTFRIADEGGRGDFAVGYLVRDMLLHKKEHFFYAFFLAEIAMNGRYGIYIAVLPDLQKNIRQIIADLKLITVPLLTDQLPGLFDLQDDLSLPSFGRLKDHKGK